MLRSGVGAWCAELMPATASAAAAMAASGGTRCRLRFAFFQNAVAATDHPADGFARFGVVGQRSVHHALAQLEAARFFSGRLVNVSRHGREFTEPGQRKQANRLRAWSAAARIGGPGGEWSRSAGENAPTQGERSPPGWTLQQHARQESRAPGRRAPKARGYRGSLHPMAGPAIGSGKP